jgi:hypothetical protein
METMNVSTILAIILCAGVASAAEKKPAVTVRLFTSAPAEGLVDEDSKQRQASAKQIRDRLKKRDGIVVVGDDQPADVTVEVLSSTREANGGVAEPIMPIPRGGFRNQSEPAEENRVLVRLTAGSNSRQFIGSAKSSWSFAAADAEGQIRKWIDDNRKTIIERR